MGWCFLQTASESIAVASCGGECLGGQMVKTGLTHNDNNNNNNNTNNNNNNNNNSHVDVEGSDVNECSRHCCSS